MRYGSVCSGIEAASVAWEPLGWKPAWFCEIEPFPSAVLAHHYPEVKNHGDFTKLIDPAHPVHDEPPIDILVGGTPCQAFSVAGLRAGLADPRGGLTLEFIRLVRALRPRWVVWENVPGVLSQDGGRAFGAFLGALAESGYGWAYRVLDAQYVRVDGYPGAVPQRRKRVFVVGCAGGDFARAAAVLLEPAGVRRNSPPSREARKATTGRAAEGSSFWNGGDVAETLTCTSDDQRLPDKNRMQMVVHPVAFSFDYGQSANPKATHQFCVEHTAPLIKERVHAVGKMNAQDAYTGRILPVAFDTYNHAVSDVCQTIKSPSGGANESVGTVLTSMAVRRLTPIECERLQGFPDDYTGRILPVAHGFYPTEGRDFPCFKELSPTVKVGSGGNNGNHPGVMHPVVFDSYNQTIHNVSFPLRCGAGHGKDDSVPRVLHPPMAVRRLTPVECERLQGFPDNYTRIPWKKKPADECPDGGRYKALGNSMAVNCMRWIGRRIELVEQA